MNVLYCGDKNIAEGLAISVLSLAKQINEQLNIYVLTTGYTSENKVCEPLKQDMIEKLESYIRQKNANHSITLIDISQLFAMNPPVANMNTRFTPCCMLRLYADLVPILPDRILYLDTDVICRLDCREFYYQDIGNAEVAGVLDHYGKWFFRKHLLHMDYLNSGVLLLNLKKIRETGLFQKCRECCATKQMFMPDQSAINKLAVSKYAISRCYNEQRKLKQNTVFQHFTTTFRIFPWPHTVTVKPWQPERLHKILKIYEYDDLLEEYSYLKANVK